MIHASQKLIRAIRSHFSGLDRGAAVVETAIAVPILLLVIMGSIEFGFAWEAKSASTSGVRTGVLRAASIGDRPETDMRILQSIIGEVGADDFDRIEWVIVFDASATDKDARIQNCLNGAFTDCVVYERPFIAQVAGTTNAAAFQLANFDSGAGGVTGGYNCDGKEDNNWCAGKRSVNGDIEIGVAIRYEHEWFTGIFPFDAPTYQDFSVSSTFLSGGATVTGTGATVIPSNIGVVGNSSFSNGIPLNGAGTTWSVGTDKIDATHEFLGQFGTGETVTSTVETPVPHDKVCVTFTLHIIDSWDGEAFNFTLGGQTFSQNYTQDGSAPQTYGNTNWGDQTFTISECVPHTSTAGVSMSFGSTLNQNVNDESWAIDNVVVTVQNG